MKNLIFCLPLFLFGCASPNRIVVHTGTVIGLQIAENPATQLYEAKLGYVRSELAILPHATNGVPADVLMELSYGGILSQDSSIKQRLAVGAVAVSQPGAFALFARDASGKLDTNAIAVARALASIPQPRAEVTATLVPLARAYLASARKADFDAVAVLRGYQSFQDFLARTNLSVEDVLGMRTDLKVKALVQ